MVGAVIRPASCNGEGRARVVGQEALTIGITGLAEISRRITQFLHKSSLITHNDAVFHNLSLITQ